MCEKDKPHYIPTFKLNREYLESIAEENTSPRIVEDKVGLSVAEQITTFFNNNPKITREQIQNIGKHGYDEQTVIDHYDKTGELPIGRLIGEDYFEIYDKNKMLLERYKLAQQKLANGEQWQVENGDKPSDSLNAVTSAINNKPDNNAELTELFNPSVEDNNV